jgi:AcrR family transcriptional regulator
MSGANRMNKPSLTSGKIGRPSKLVTTHLDEMLLDLASQAMREANFSDISLERLAARIGVSRPTIYRRFENRNALLEALVEKEFSTIFVTGAPNSDEDADPLEILRSQAWEMFEVFLRPSTANFVKFLTQESMINPRLANSRREWHMRVVHRLAPHIARLFKPRDAERLAILLIALLDTPITLRAMGFDTEEALSGMSEEAYFAWRFGIFLKSAAHAEP